MGGATLNKGRVETPNRFGSASRFPWFCFLLLSFCFSLPLVLVFVTFESASRYPSFYVSLFLVLPNPAVLGFLLQRQRATSAHKVRLVVASFGSFAEALTLLRPDSVA